MKKRNNNLLLLSCVRKAKSGLVPFISWWTALHPENRRYLESKFGIDVYGKARKSELVRKRA